MKLNAGKTTTMSLKVTYNTSPVTPINYIDGTVQKESDDIDILGVTFDSKMTFEKHLCYTGLQISFSKTWILRKSSRVFHDRLLLEICFRGFVLPVLEYRSSVWCLAVHSHLKLLDGIVSGTSFF